MIIKFISYSHGLPKGNGIGRHSKEESSSISDKLSFAYKVVRNGCELSSVDSERKDALLISLQ